MVDDFDAFAEAEANVPVVDPVADAKIVDVVIGTLTKEIQTVRQRNIVKSLRHRRHKIFYICFAAE